MVIFDLLMGFLCHELLLQYFPGKQPTMNYLRQINDFLSDVEDSEDLSSTEWQKTLNDQV